MGNTSSPASGVQCGSDTPSDVCRSAVHHRKRRVVQNADRMFRLVGKHDAVTDMVEHRGGRWDLDSEDTFAISGK